MQFTPSFFNRGFLILLISSILLPRLIAQSSITLQPVFHEDASENSLFYSKALSISSPITTPFIHLTGYTEAAAYTGSISYRIHSKDQWSPWLPFNRHENPSNLNRPYYQTTPLRETTDSIQFKADRQMVVPLVCRFYFPGHSSEVPYFFRSEKSPINCTQPDYCERACWCPEENCPTDPTPVATKVSHVIVHHSAGHTNSTNFQAVVRSYWDDHVNTRGWDDIGYNWLIDRNGIIYEGRGADRLGAHFSCMNEQTVGICLIGDFQDATPTEEALLALKNLIAWVAAKDQLDVQSIAYHESSQLDLDLIAGHRDGGISMLACSSTVCPGENLYKELPLLREEVSAFACLEEVLEDSMLTSTVAPVSSVDISIQPNPTSGATTIFVECTNNGPLDLYLQDMLGRSYYLGRDELIIGENYIARNLNTYPTGIYILTSRMDGRYAQHTLLIK